MSGPVLRSGSLRDRVQALVPAFLAMRSLGAMQMPAEQGEAEAARTRILRYLQLHSGQVIEGHELMVISGIGDYPRRIRELRVQYGWPIISGVTVNQMEEDDSEEHVHNDLPHMRPDEYILMENARDSAAASRWKLANGIRRSTGGVREKILRYLRANVGKPVTGEELRYVANNRKEWARRSRELRTEEGWPVATRFSGRPELPMGAYVLEEDRQAPPHDRHIKEKIRRDVLVRDNYKCRDCGWSHASASPADVRFLELHHLIHHSKRGENIEENLLTLCNICHDERHRQEKSTDS
jgi:Restriction endonuclease